MNPCFVKVTLRNPIEGEVKVIYKNMSLVSTIPEVAELVEALEELVDLMEGVYQGEYIPDSLTTQPARAALAAYRAREGGLDKEDVRTKATVTLDKEDVLNIISWDWNQLKEKPDSIDWIPALRALEKLEKIANKQLFEGK